jgi:signal transduction histidine kinase
MRGQRSDILPQLGDVRHCRQLWELIEVVRERPTDAVQGVAERLGIVQAAHAALLARLRTPSGAQRAALCDAAWEPYRHELEALGAECAGTGVDLHAWFDVLEADQTALLALAASHGAELQLVAAGLRELVMTHVGRGYVEAQSGGARSPNAPHELYLALFRNSATGMLVYRFEDRADLGSFRLVSANAAAARVSHPRIFEQVGKTLRQTSPYLLDTEVPQQYAAAVLEGQSRIWTITTDGKGLANKTYEARCFPLMGDYVGVAFEDISVRCQMEEQVRHHIAELERSNRELDDFAYAASHDLKAPLQDVKNLSAWICEDLGEALPVDTARHARTMLDRLGRMERLLDDLLAYSRAGRDRAPPEQFAIRDVLEDVIALTPLPPGFRIEVLADVAPIRTPRSPLAQVLRNLLGNAIKHHDRDHGLLTIEAREAKDRVHISVTDDGPGIPPEFHERVFRIFQTLRPRDAVEGSGIGLAIVKKVVESHGGAVTIDSIGRGTTVRFSWPRVSKA